MSVFLAFSTAQQLLVGKKKLKAWGLGFKVWGLGFEFRGS